MFLKSFVFKTLSNDLLYNLAILKTFLPPPPKIRKKPFFRFFVLNRPDIDFVIGKVHNGLLEA